MLFSTCHGIEQRVYYRNELRVTTVYCELTSLAKTPIRRDEHADGRERMRLRATWGRQRILQIGSHHGLGETSSRLFVGPVPPHTAAAAATAGVPGSMNRSILRNRCGITAARSPAVALLQHLMSLELLEARLLTASNAWTPEQVLCHECTRYCLKLGVGHRLHATDAHGTLSLIHI